VNRTAEVVEELGCRGPPALRRGKARSTSDSGSMATDQHAQQKNGQPSSEQTHWCPVMRPTRAEFQKPFMEYVAGVFAKDPDLPMFKVCVPS
jgi:hypothetical protein